MNQLNQNQVLSDKINKKKLSKKIIKKLLFFNEKSIKIKYW